jgi:hypothetical protein
MLLHSLAAFFVGERKMSRSGILDLLPTSPSAFRPSMNVLRQFRLLLAAIVLAGLTAPVRAQTVSAEGQRLAKLLDGMDVDHLWISKEYVHWKSGKPIDKPVNDEKPHTHCSAFAAAVADRLNIYLLHPPEHGATDLANAQCDWLPGPGAAQGWQPVSTPEEAQALANAGNLVVAVFKEDDPKRHGHAAVIRPAEKSRAQIEAEGPQVAQAGMENYSNAPLATGFRHHPGAWENRRVRFYAHAVDWDHLDDAPARSKRPKKTAT